MNGPSEAPISPGEGIPQDTNRVLPPHLTTRRVVRTASGRIGLENFDLVITRWNSAFNLVGSVASAHPNDPRIDDPTFLLLKIDLPQLTTHFQHLSVKQLRTMASSHGLTFRLLNKHVLTAMLIAHDCNLNCTHPVYIFKELPNPRPPWVQPPIRPPPLFSHRLPTDSTQALVAEPSMQTPTEDDYVTISPGASEAIKIDMKHLRCVSESDKERIVKEWQQEMDPSRFLRHTCAVCSELKYFRDIERIHGREVPLYLLRNRDLPEGLLPTSYDREAYDQAILDPQGLEDKQQKSWMSICPSCARDLNKGEMPRLALANWLYYARDKLPEEVDRAFREMSIFEKTLVSRLRTNSILCRFTGFDHDLNGATFATGRRHIRGNIISTPMDTARIHDVLPPSPQEIADTICALIVSNQVPSRSNVDSLAPILVRKSRVKLLIQFLLEHNHHYKLSESFQGFSTENLDALFTGSRTSGVPDNVQIAHIPINEAIEGGVSDYIRRFETLEGVFMENVSYTLGDHSPQSFREMCLLALQHCKTGKPFLYAKSGSVPVPDIGNPNWLSWAHPNADPFGIGGFHDPRRKKPIGMEIQLRHMLNVRDPFFERDPELAFDVYNIVRKQAVNNTLRFRVPYTSYSRVVDDIIRMNKDTIVNLQAKFRQNPNYKPTTGEETSVLRTMTSISPIARHIPGTTAQKIKMRNEIRSIISQRGSPTLFVTLNPADYYNPIVTVLATRAKDASDMTNLDALATSERASLAIKHPVACAQFFDSMIKAFVRIVLRHGRKDKVSGIFGKCDAYYGTVETQGRGSLHCHMLIWLKGHLPPEILQCALRTSERYRADLQQWIDSIVDSGFIGNRSYLNNVQNLRLTDDELGRTKEPHPGTTQGPLISTSDRDSFKKESREFVDDLLLRFNWHGHSASCWKYLRPGEEKSASSCRFGMDGAVRPITEIDAHTGSISVRRRHPKMTQYNPTITLLMKCNTDIKFIGSGEDAKAFMYYVTDYITKSPLSMHAGLSALSFAIQKGENRGLFAERSSDEPHGRRLMTLALNSMLGRQEISHPQVMSYISGAGENYTSERFQAFNWAEVIRYVTAILSSLDSPQDDAAPNIHVSVSREVGVINASNQLLDYIYRPECEPFHSMGMYRHISLTTKSPKKAASSTSPHELPRSTSNRPYSSENHPQFHSHVTTLRTLPVVPVLLGPRISKNKGSEVEREEWARDMCILFRPWRHPTDLKAHGDRWSESLQALLPLITEEDKKIMENMSLVAEGKSARDSRPRGNRRRADASAVIPEGEEGDIQVEEEDDSRERNVFGLLLPTRISPDATPLRVQLSEHLCGLLGAESATAFQSCMPHSLSEPCISGQQLEHVQDTTITSQGPLQALQQSFMVICKHREADQEADPCMPLTGNDFSGPRMVNRQVATHGPESSITILVEGRNPFVRHTDPWTAVTNLVAERKMNDNAEQLRSFNIIAHHVIEGGPQLLMYVGGKGGTGKSYLVQSIVQLFDRLGISTHLRLGAPTGIAASLIGGNTLHSLLNLGPTSKSTNNDKITREWRAVRYLIVDEVSMVGAHFMATISSRLRAAKADTTGDCQKMFGGVNMIFMGDLFQLSPPKQPCLFAHRLVKNPSFVQTRDNGGIDALAGAFLWRQVDTVVILDKSQRHASDPLFGEILERIRTGAGIITDGVLARLQGTDILEHLRRRELTRVAADNPSELPLFQDAPVIVGSKIIRDALNASLLVAHAARLGQRVHLYHSTDQLRGKNLPAAVANRLRTLPTRSTNESLGLLPIFIGMRVMITENISVPYKIVNGSEGTVVDIMWTEAEDGIRTADVVYVKVPGCDMEAPGLERGIVPIFPSSVSVPYSIKVGQATAKSFRRRQVPIVPAYSYTDYKSQGRTLERAIVDITSARGQGIYVMLSRVTSIQGLLILRWFPNNRILQRMSEELRTEIARLNQLNTRTLALYSQGLFNPVPTS